MGIFIVALYFIYLIFCNYKEEGGMNTLMGVGCFSGVILLFSLYLTFFEFVDRLEKKILNKERKNSVNDNEFSLVKYWPISIWTIYWNGIKDECRYGRLIPRPTEKKGGKIEEE